MFSVALPQVVSRSGVRIWTRRQPFAPSSFRILEMLNHSNERMTMRYMGKLGDDVVAAYAQAL